jgi:type III restriction enzyme
VAGGADGQHPDAAEAGGPGPAGAALLALVTGTFYLDFFAELNDGRVLLAEYKGEHLVEHERQKKNIGERWEETSGGKALFLWAVKKDEHGRDVHRQLQDKLAKS